MAGRILILLHGGIHDSRRSIFIYTTLSLKKLYSSQTVRQIQILIARQIQILIAQIFKRRRHLHMFQ